MCQRHRLTDQLGDRLKLDVASPLVNRADLAISPELLQGQITGETDSARPLDRLARDLLRDDRGVVSAISSVLGRASSPAYFAMAASFVNGRPSSFSLAALYVSSRAASILIAAWANWCPMDWKSPTN